MFILNKKILTIIVLFVFVTCSKQILIVRGGGEILKRTVAINNKNYSYHVYLPVHYNPTKKWPVMLYLHGSGQKGNIWQISSGLGRALRQHPERFPFIVVFPECPIYDYWIGKMITYAVKALDETVKEFNGDIQRLYLSGVSMGGYGTLICAVRYPGKFAALAPVCGGVSPPFEFSKKVRAQISPKCLVVLDSQDPYSALAPLICKTPVWAFHGSMDTAIPVSESRKIVAALKAIDCNVKYTEYKTMGHNIWNKVYMEQEFLTWLLSQRLDR